MKAELMNRVAAAMQAGDALPRERDLLVQAMQGEVSNLGDLPIAAQMLVKDLERRGARKGLTDGA